MNDMRERLIELLTDNLPRIGEWPKCDNPLQYKDDAIVGRLADHLLANGIIVLPCKVGDTVYYFQDGASTSKCAHCDFFDTGGFGEPVFCSKTKNGRRAASCIEIVERTISYDNILYYSDSRLFGKTAFLTREEAERALKEREQNEC